jgi:hypothetical protein
MSPERLAEIQTQGTGVGIRGMRERVRSRRFGYRIQRFRYESLRDSPIEDSTFNAQEQHAARCSMKPNAMTSGQRCFR